MYKSFFKRMFDLILSVSALPFFLVILIIIGPIIYFHDKGSIFYNSTRLGKNGKIFKMYKFRSMVMNAQDIRNEDGSTFNSEDDPRLTKIGKFIRRTSLDETPQLLNIIKGDMSLVGPRPDLESQKSKYNEEKLDSTKFQVLPGITGYAQVNGRNNITWIEKLKLDNYYVYNCSLALDIQIIIKTIINIFLAKGVYIKGAEKNEKYNY